MPRRYRLPRVELRHLRYFVAVAETGSVSRAATDRLHVAQPSLSRQIRDLEKEVGVPLLERTPRGIRLTDAGHAFLAEARTILKYADEAVLRARAIGGKRETELHAGIFPLVAARMMPGILRDYHKAMPNVHVQLHDWPEEKQIAAVRDGQLQLAIIIPPLTGHWRRQLRFEELMSLRVCLAVSCQPSFRATQGRLISRGSAPALHWTAARGISATPRICGCHLRTRERQAAIRGGARRLGRPFLCGGRRDRGRHRLGRF